MTVSNQTAICIAYIVGFLATPIFFVVAGIIRIFFTLIQLVMDSTMLIPNLVNQVKHRRNII